MKKIYLLLIAVLAFAGTASAQIAAWNISDEAFNALGSMEVTTTVDGLTIYAIAGKAVVVDENGKSVTYKEVEYTYTHRLKFGVSGAFTDGTPSNRVIAFDVDGPCDITVMAQSSSGDTDRSLNVAAGSDTNILGEVEALGASIGFTTISYTDEEATTIYMWSPSSGVNIYHILVEEPGTVSVQTPEFEGRVVSTVFYNINGMKVDNRFDALPAGIYMQVKQYENGAIATEKIIKSRR